MKTHTTHKHESGEHLVEDAQALLTATAHVAEEKVVEARKRLGAAIEKGKETWNNVQEKAVAGFVEIQKNVINAVGIETRSAPLQTMNFVSFGEKKLS